MRPSSASRDKDCALGKTTRFISEGAKKAARRSSVEMLALDLAVVDAVVPQQLLVAVVKGIARAAPVVIEDRAPAAWLEDADEFGYAVLFEIEPVHRLGNGDQVDGVIGEAGGFGGSHVLPAACGNCSSGWRMRRAFLVRLDGGDGEPAERSISVSMPVPAATSAMVEPEVRPHSRASRSTMAGG